MELQISNELRRATTKCPSGFSCLAGDKKDLCAVESCIGRELYFINCLQDGQCAYRHPFGRGHYCMCPVRKELFNKYKI